MLFVMTLTTLILDVKPLPDYVKDSFLTKMNFNKNQTLGFSLINEIC